ncbi:hypothetical protein DYU05_15180 [Mucilaginibacter terrenus]|uniref:Uncharacterized protein n=1 Tax=Mucilaginibacter terrenus TaxID=2482727 RepID=A0A3E2NRG0_9SPHI|nr:hypothetical protein [Mucilaginibacter terrenus]RFZ83470.1 hypothetical protein DYU05_15180 [Mucilaginibacter terrenus]
MIDTEELLPEVTSIDAKVFLAKHVRLATFLGGPIAGGYIIAENYKALNDYRMAKNTWAVTLLVTVAVFGAILYLPGVSRLPSVFFPLLFSLAGYQLTVILQDKRLYAYMNNGGTAYNWGRPVVVSLIACVVQLFLIFIVAIASDMTALLH